jgi:ethanolamine ammonia-lyase large subunit
VVTRLRNTIGLPGTMAVRLQPNMIFETAAAISGVTPGAIAARVSDGAVSRNSRKSPTALIPYEADDVTRLILDTHDAAAFARIGHLTVGDFRSRTGR